MPTQAEIDARLARYRASTDGRDLWPEVPVAAFRAAQEEVARVASAVLAGASEPVPLRLPPGVDARALGVAASAGGMGPLLGLWCEAGRVMAEPPVASLFATHLEHGRRRAKRLHAGLDRVVTALADRGVEVLLLKGADTAYRYFPEPGTRPGADVDVLVRPSERPVAADVLRELSFVEVPASVRPERSHWVPSEAQKVRSVELAHADNPWSVDLHVTLERRPYPGLTITPGSVDLNDGEQWRGLSRPVRVLSQPLLLAHLAVHASAHIYHISLIRLVELVLVARRDFAGRPERWRALDDLLGAAAARRFAFPSLDLAERLAPGTVDLGVLERLRTGTPRRLRRLVRGMTPGNAQRLHPTPLGERFVWAASPGQFVVFLADSLWPREGGRLVSPWQALGALWRRVRWLLRLAAKAL